MSDTEHTNSAVRCTFAPDTGVATLVLAMEGRVNVINDTFGIGLDDALTWALGRQGLKGIILDSAHKDFCAGADIDAVFLERDAARMYARVRQLSGLYRKLETCGVPVVCVLAGTALGGGYELALSCHRRIAVDDPAIKVGLPEVQLGLIPGAGGTQRLPRLIGIQAALELIAEGREIRAPKAVKSGLVDELAPSREAAHRAAIVWIAANPRAKQPWDKGDKIPGPQPGSADARNMIMAGAGMLRKKTAGVFEAPEAALSAVSEGLLLTIDGGLDVEARYFTKLAVGDQSKDMIRTLWYFRTAALKGEGLPRAETDGFKRIAVIGAGMMGAGLAYVCADAGYDVVLKDVSQESLDRGIAHFDKQIADRKKNASAEDKAALRARLHPTLDDADLAGTDLVIEAVFENLDLKLRVNRDLEPHLTPTGIWASNTSALPIGDVSRESKIPERFIGLHYFSPVEVMPLLEIVLGPKTDEATLARCLAFARKTKKIPIVVNDGYAFYTTRVFSAFILEGAQLVAEGHDPVLIEWAAKQAGMVVPPLQVFDEVTLTLGVKAVTQGKQYLGDDIDTDGVALIKAMVEEHQRPSKAAGAGFYEYDGGKRKRLWPGLKQLAKGSPTASGVELLADRLLLIQCVMAANCLEQGILRSKRDAEVGAIFGIGFAPQTGGPLAYMDRRGLANVVARLDEFAAAYGKRYAPPKLLREMATQGTRFFPEGELPR
jgi:3-hydroxyacyl-CoA dehydrogenase/enoyl-CoA hydratase/3-hydroxybutyryl-CoA epimerase